MFPALPTDEHELDPPQAHALTTLPPCTTQENDWDEAWHGAKDDTGFWRGSANEEVDLTEPTLTLNLDPALRAEFDDEPIAMPEVVVEAPLGSAARVRQAISRLFRSRGGSDESA